MKKYINKFTVSVMAVFAFIALLPLQAVLADSGASLKLPANASAAIDIEIPQAHGEKVSSLQLSLEITKPDGNPSDADTLQNIEKLSFTPDESVSSTAKICEGRYNKEAGRLDIYIAGTEPLFSESGILTLGTVNAAFVNNNASDIYIRVKDESLKVVKGLVLKTISEEFGETRLYLEGNQEPSVTSRPTSTPEPGRTETPQEPDKTSAPDNPGNSQAPSQPGTPDTPGSGTNPSNPGGGANPSNPNGSADIPGPDLSKLNSALETAATLTESDYTADSYALLKKAVENGRAVLNNPNASQEEIEQAADAIYNAIGALVPSSKSSAENKAAASPSSKQSKASLTGDANAVGLCIIILVISMGIIGVAAARKKRQN